MITGYNHNVKYKEDIFHVQTEDSGKDKAHIITHLFFGGNIIKSTKASYHELLAIADWEAQVASLMQKQHKDMLRGLIKGTFDEQITQRQTGASFLNGPAPLNVDEGSQHKTSFGGGEAPSSQQPVPETIQKPTEETYLGDGTFTVTDSFLESLMKAAPVLAADDLEKALDKDDDNFVFGQEDESKGLGDMMLGFMQDLDK